MNQSVLSKNDQVEVTQQLLSNINNIVQEPFTSLEEFLAFYQKELPIRVGDYHQEEVGPIFHKNQPGEADKFTSDIFTLGEDTYEMTDGLDWYAAPGGDLEWNGGLVRHGYFVLLANEYIKTGNEIYANTIVDHITDYIQNVPPFEPEGKPYLDYKKSTWRPFEAAGRAAENWPEALAKIINSAAMTPLAWAKIYLSIYEHACFLRKHHWSNGNHATLEVAAVGIISIFFREYKISEEWLKYSIDFLNKMWDDLFYIDGYTRENSGSYHWVAMRSYFSFYEVACNNGFSRKFPGDYTAHLVRTSLAEFYQDKPDYSTPITNDSSSNIKRQVQLNRINKLLRIPQIEYRLTEGNSGIKPDMTSCFFTAARLAIMRENWTDQSCYLAFDMGSWGDNHMNQDQLTIDLDANGRHFLIGGGKWRYTTSDQNAAWMPWAKYFKRTPSYNTVTVNGYDQVFGDASGKMKICDRYDYATGVFSAGYGEEVPGRDEELFRTRGISTKMEVRLSGVRHERKIIFIKEGLWVLRDEISGPGLENAEQYWHFYDGDLKSADNDPHMWYTGFDDANLIIKSLGSGVLTPKYFKGSEDPIAGWHCPYYNQKRPSPELRYYQEGSEKICFHTLFLPVKGRISSMPVFNYEEGVYTVSLDEKTWKITAPASGEWSIL